MTDVNLIAVMDPKGFIGPEGSRPELIDNQLAREFTSWFLRLTQFGVIVVGSNTYAMMLDAGFKGLFEDWSMIVWSRDLDLTPAEFIDDLREHDAPIWIAGGAKTYEVFMPFVDNFHIRRAPMKGPLTYRLPPI